MNRMKFFTRRGAHKRASKLNIEQGVKSLAAAEKRSSGWRRIDYGVRTREKGLLPYEVYERSTS